MRIWPMRLLLDEFLEPLTSQGLTQEQLAVKKGTTQTAVARMSSGSGKHLSSLATPINYANALGCKLEIRLVLRPRTTGDMTSRIGPASYNDQTGLMVCCPQFTQIKGHPFEVVP